MKYLTILVIVIVLFMLLTGCSNRSKIHYYDKQQRTTQSSFDMSVPYEGGSCRWRNKTMEVNLHNGVGYFIACDNNRIFKSGRATAGAPGKYRTPSGTWSVKRKYELYDSIKYPSENGGYNMMYAQFYDRGFALHSGDIRRYSHGCIRVQHHNAAWLWYWSSRGTRVVVHNF